MARDERIPTMPVVVTGVVVAILAILGFLVNAPVWIKITVAGIGMTLVVLAMMMYYGEGE